METLIQPGLPQAAGLSPADEAAEQAVTSSVMAAGLLPRQAWITPAGAGVDVSGLGWRPGQQSPLAVPVIRDAGLDTMRIELDHVVMATPGCGPADTVLDYVPDILDGFTQTYQLCSRHTGELAGLLAAFDGDQVRVLLRPTLWYGAVLGASFHPDLLGDALDRERHFDALWRDVPDRPGLAACIPAERADLWRNDIPVFTAVTSEPILRDADGQPVAGLTLVPGMDRLRIRLNSLGEADLAQQRWLIAGALATSAIEITETAPQPAGLQLAAGPPLVPAAHDRFGQDLLLQTADAIGRHLARIAFVAEGSAQWLGLHSAHGQTWMLDPLPPDLFDGLTGVALFLGWLGRMTADDEHTALARAALATAGQQLDRGALAGAGGMAGLGGLAYALAELGKLWSDDHLIDAAEQRALAITSQAGQDVMFDVAGGSAGTIAGLAALHSIRPSAPLRDAIRACADRLLATAIRTSTGIGWLSDQIRHSRGAQLPIAGYAHGIAGAIAPLFQAAQILQDQRYDDAARAALSYGQALFNSCTGTWTDLCSTAKARAPVTAGQQSLSWCYGSTGIGLSRLQILPYTGPAPLIAQEIDAALAALAALTSQPAGSHCLCHGALGHIDLLLQAATVLSRPALHQAARQHATHMATVISQHGCICGTPLNIETPGLMTGLAGIGYGLLRTINPQLLPAVLTLSPATTS